MSSDYIQAAFQTVLHGATAANGAYVTLYRIEQRYGGPEEGGWWADDWTVEAYQHFPSIELAEASATAVERLSEQLTQGDKEAHDSAMRASCDWCEARGIDPADHPGGEPDGPARYVVKVEENLGESTKTGPTHYE